MFGISGTAARSILIAGCVSCGGCAFGTIEQGTKLDPAKVEQVRIGMTKSQVLTLFGPPQEFRRPELLDVLFSDVSQKSAVDASAAIFNDVFSYRYTHGDVKVASAILLTWMAADVKSDELIVFFDDKDKVKYFAWRPDSGGEPETRNDEVGAFGSVTP